MSRLSWGDLKRSVKSERAVLKAFLPTFGGGPLTKVDVRARSGKCLCWETRELQAIRNINVGELTNIA